MDKERNLCISLALLLHNTVDQKKIFHQKCPNFGVWPSIYLLNNALLFFSPICFSFSEKIEAKISKSRRMVCNEAKQKEMFT